MSENIQVGDYVKLLDLPSWLLKDIPSDEAVEITDCIGKTAQVTEIDKFGYFWVGFGIEHSDGEFSYYSGHSFCVEKQNLELVSKPINAD